MLRCPDDPCSIQARARHHQGIKGLQKGRGVLLIKSIHSPTRTPKTPLPSWSNAQLLPFSSPVLPLRLLRAAPVSTSSALVRPPLLPATALLALSPTRSSLPTLAPPLRPSTTLLAVVSHRAARSATPTPSSKVSRPLPARSTPSTPSARTPSSSWSATLR